MTTSPVAPAPVTPAPEQETPAVAQQNIPEPVIEAPVTQTPVIETPVAPVPVEPVIVKKDVYILANSLNVRSSPSLEAVRVGAAKLGQKFEYIQENDEWVEIRLSPTLTGWVFKQYVSISEQ